ncbi:MAG: hypothetical protein CL610_29245 [Anaerolineaceae bacterium]|nr:hypothetical protein [Anaerolineaceae bacterium]
MKLTMQRTTQFILVYSEVHAASTMDEYTHREVATTLPAGRVAVILINVISMVRALADSRLPR